MNAITETVTYLRDYSAPTTLRGSLRKAMCIRAWVFGIALIGYFGFRLLQPAMFDGIYETSTPMVVPSQVEVADSPTARMVEEHGCWPEAAPADMEGKMPGHVVTINADGEPVYGGPKVAAAAIDQQFAHVNHNLTIAAFCR